jgi:3-methyladenine DNA glycosylase/8-oxoguanine DNA glycosylase
MKEESQHAVLDEMEWQRHDATVTAAQRDAGVTELIELVGAVDGLLQMQATADADYFMTVNARRLSKAEAQSLRGAFLKAYRWQYIVSGAQNERFLQILGAMLTPAQLERVVGALKPLMEDALNA